MKFKDAISKNIIMGGFKLKGRASRSEFWYFTLFIYASLILCVVIFSLISKNFDYKYDEYYEPSLFSMVLIVVLGIFFINLFIAGFLLMIRRLHDLNYSGLWILPLFISAIVVNLIHATYNIVGLVYLVIMAIPGTKGSNKYGDDPVVKKEIDRSIKE